MERAGAAAGGLRLHLTGVVRTAITGREQVEWAAQLLRALPPDAQFPGQNFQPLRSCQASRAVPSSRLLWKDIHSGALFRSIGSGEFTPLYFVPGGLGSFEAGSQKTCVFLRARSSSRAKSESFWKPCRGSQLKI